MEPSISNVLSNPLLTKVQITGLCWFLHRPCQPLGISLHCFDDRQKGINLLTFGCTSRLFFFLFLGDLPF